MTSQRQINLKIRRKFSSQFQRPMVDSAPKRIGLRDLLQLRLQMKAYINGNYLLYGIIFGFGTIIDIRTDR